MARLHLPSIRSNTPNRSNTLPITPATVRKQHNHTNTASLLARQQAHTLSSPFFTKPHLTHRTPQTTLLHAIDNATISNTLHSHSDPNAHRNSNRAQHRPAAALMLHMSLSHPPLSIRIVTSVFVFEPFHESISFPSSPARFPHPLESSSFSPLTLGFHP